MLCNVAYTMCLISAIVMNLLVLKLKFTKLLIKLKFTSKCHSFQTNVTIFMSTYDSSLEEVIVDVAVVDPGFRDKLLLSNRSCMMHADTERFSKRTEDYFDIAALFISNFRSLPFW